MAPKFLLALLWFMAALTSSVAAHAEGQAVVFEGARLIKGDGTSPIENSRFIVEGGEFIAAGRPDDVAIPAGAVKVDLTGKTVMPALLDGHVHLGYRKGATFLPGNYTRETLLDTLDRFAFFGAGAVLEAGTARGELPFKIREEVRSSAATRYLTCGSGFAMPLQGPGGPMRDSTYGVTAEDQARDFVRKLAASKPDMVKIWVDDRKGTVDKLKPELYRAIIDEAHRHHLKVMAHIVNLEDAKDLLRAGVDGFAHMVRDKDVDDELLALLKDRPEVFFFETLWAERRGMYASTPAWANDPILSEMFTAEERTQLATQLHAGPEAARSVAETAVRNTARLHAAGVRLGLGTDTGGMLGSQFFGFGTHIELELLVTKVGLSPMQALAIGTRNTAAILGLDRLGTVARGKSADFIVLDANPLEDISNTRRIARVYLRGEQIQRASSILQK
jgi:imidazolonepropionase-like amidohydrolase